MTRDTKNMIAALDIGTSKVLVVVAEVMADGRHEVVGIGQKASNGVRKGVIVNADVTIESIKQAIDEAERMANCKIRHIHTSLASPHIRSFNSRGMIPIKERAVTVTDVDRVIATAKAVLIQKDHQLLHAVPQTFTVGSQEDVRNPVGMAGVRLEVDVHLITCPASSIQNVINCVQRCGLDTTELILQPIASAESVLTEDEKDLGVVLVDIGGGTTDIAIYFEGALRHTAIIQIAGDQITSDIAIALRTPKAEAEKIKVRYGVAHHTLANQTDTLEVPGSGDRAPRTLSRMALATIIEPRVEELLTIVREVVRASGFDGVLSSGIVLTGGSSKMPGIVGLAEDVFQNTTRLGQSNYRGNMSENLMHPGCSTVLGLLLEAKKKYLKERHVDHGDRDLRAGWFKVKTWFLDNF
jgi:cell division protein FtsA